MPGLQPQSLPAMALKGLMMMDEGSKILAAVLPGISPPAVDAVAKLRQSVPRALMELQTGGSSLPAGPETMPNMPGMPGAPGASGMPGPVPPPGPAPAMGMGMAA